MAKLPAGSVRLNTSVAKIEPQAVILEDGQRAEGSSVIVATNASMMCRLLLDFEYTEPKWRSVTTLYFTADNSPINEATIYLNGSGSGRVNSVSVLSDVAATYAPPAKALLSVVILGLPEENGLEKSVQEGLTDWFVPVAKTWQHLRTDWIEQALPEQPPKPGRRNHPKGFPKHKDVCICGDHLYSASMEGSVISGKQVAESILRSR